MKTHISLTIMCIELFSRLVAQAQGTITYLSNLGLPSAGSQAIASNSWVAADFITGNNPGGYSVNSVQLAMANATANPSGFEAMIYGQNPASLPAPEPGSIIGILDGSLNPSMAGVYNYTPASDMTLSPDTDYFIVLTAGTGFTGAAYRWSYAGTDAYNPTGGWTSGQDWFSSDGSHWGGGADQDAQFAITATAIPEPSVTSLLLLGGGLVVYIRRQKPALRTRWSSR